MTTDNEKIILGEIETETEDTDVLNALEAVVKRVLPKNQTPSQKVANSISQHAKIELGASRRRRIVIEKLDQIEGKTGEELRLGLLKGKLQISDSAPYSVQPAINMDIDLIKTDGAVAVGKNSFDNAKLDKFALIHGVFLRYSEGSTETDERYDKPLPAEIVNGELTLKVDTREIVSKLPIEKIASFGVMPSDKPFNYIELDNPKWIIPGKTIEAVLKGAGNVGSGFLKIMFDCSVIQPM